MAIKHADSYLKSNLSNGFIPGIVRSMGPKLTSSLVNAMGATFTADIVRAMGPALTASLVICMGPEITQQLCAAFGTEFTAQVGQGLVESAEYKSHDKEMGAPLHLIQCS